MGEEARARRPRPAETHVDVRPFALSPTDGFVLSRIDGSLDEDELAALTGLGAAELEGSLKKLRSFGLITFGDRAVPEPPPRVPLTFGDRAAPEPPPHVAPRTSGIAKAFSPLDADDEAALEEDVELDTAVRREIVAMHRAASNRDHYALLGVSPDADKKTVKRAYFELATKFHPDRHFRKRLGSFKSRLEVIFSRITLAHDTLANAGRRAEYDAYLAEQATSRTLEQTLAEASAEVRRAEQRVERDLQEDDGGIPPEAPTQTGRRRLGTVPETGMPVQSPALSDIDSSARRDAFARRLLGHRPRSSPSAPPTRTAAALPSGASLLSPGRAMTSSDAVAALKARYDERSRRARAMEAAKYIERGEKALAADQIISAANAFRVASGLVPDDTQLAERGRELQARADVLLGDTYVRQAQYEEKGGHWRDAARSWVRACKVRRTDAHTHERAATALVKSNGDLHEAARLALVACELEPTSAPKRVTLATVYLAAGLVQNARRELTAASRLAPDDAHIQAMLKRVSEPT